MFCTGACCTEMGDMKVLVITNLYPSEEAPTKGTFHWNLLDRLKNHCDVRVIAPVPWWWRIKSPGLMVRAPHELDRGIEAWFPSYWSFPANVRMHGAAMYYSIRGRVRRLRKDFPFDVILAAWAYPDAVAAARLADDYDCALVTKVLGSDINDTAARPALRPAVLRALRRSHRILSVSQALRSKVISMGVDPENVIAHHNGVNGQRFHVQDRALVRERLGLPADRPILCYVGNFNHEKGVDVLIAALGQLRQFHDADPLLLMVGNGPMEGALRHDLRAMGLTHNVKFVGRRPHNEIPDWIGAADVFCLPSRMEGCPNVVLEGLASGRPVVATAVGGVPELIHDGNGILARPEDPRALACAIAEALGRTWDPDALRASVEELSWDEIGRTVYEILESAVSERTYPLQAVTCLQR